MQASVSLTAKVPFMRSDMRRQVAMSVVVALALSTVVAPSAAAQTLTGQTAAQLGLVPGVRVRVVETDSARSSQTGLLAAMVDNGIVLRAEHRSDSLTIRFARMERLEVSRGRHGHVLAGLAIGLAAGAGVGAVWAASTYRSGGFQFIKQGDDALIGGILGGMVGGVAGLVTGALVRTERWHTVWVNTLVTHTDAGITMVPSPTGSRLGVRIALHV
jgi:hypothetical protein